MRQTTSVSSAKSVEPAKRRSKEPLAAPAKTAAAKPTKPAGKTRSGISTQPVLASRPAEAGALKQALSPKAIQRKAPPSPAQRLSFVEVAAYFVAERHGFAPGHEHDYWLEAEAEIDRMIAEGML